MRIDLAVNLGEVTYINGADSMDVGIDAAVAIVDAWLEEPTLEEHAQHLQNLTTQSPAAMEHLVAGLTQLAAGLTFALSQRTGMPMSAVLADMSRAIKATNADD
ncbi:hypothetical protein [Actinoplanes ianthinogenes]|uniref:hypothetical protein n=1 Tax=Actinoplanes ianthinogenes TaxID=122358 RepID=UPI00166FAC5E|nr:hypothetical protein [Actinoplanes ianthinogenes]